MPYDCVTGVLQDKQHAVLDDGDGERIVLQERRRKEERHMWVMMGWIGSVGEDEQRN